MSSISIPGVECFGLSIPPNWHHSRRQNDLELSYEREVLGHDVLALHVNFHQMGAKQLCKTDQLGGKSKVVSQLYCNSGLKE